VKLLKSRAWPLIQGNGPLFVSRVGTTLIPLITGLLAARNLGPSGRGLIGIAIAVVVALSAIAPLGVPTQFRLQLNRDRNNVEVGKYLHLMTLSSLIAGVISSFLIYLILMSQNVTNTYLIISTGLLASASVAIWTISSGLIGLHQFKRALITENLPPLFCLIIFISSMIMGQSSAVIYVAGLATGTWVNAFLGLKCLLLHFRDTKNYQSVGSMKILKSARSFWLLDSMQFLAFKSDRFFVAFLFPTTVVGAYAVASTLSSLWRLFPVTTGTLISQSDHTKRRRENYQPLYKRLAATLIPHWVILLAIGVFGPVYVVPLFGSGYAGIGNLIQLLCVAESFLAIYLVLSGFAMGRDSRRVLWLISGTGALIFPTVTLALMGSLGVNAAGVGALAAAAAVALISIAYTVLSIRRER
jgi:O-antigen/teichoic acid export membrane protein